MKSNGVLKCVAVAVGRTNFCSCANERNPFDWLQEMGNACYKNETIALFECIGEQKSIMNRYRSLIVSKCYTLATFSSSPFIVHWFLFYGFIRYVQRRIDDWVAFDLKSALFAHLAVFNSNCGFENGIAVTLQIYSCNRSICEQKTQTNRRISRNRSKTMRCMCTTSKFGLEKNLATA